MNTKNLITNKYVTSVIQRFTNPVRTQRGLRTRPAIVAVSDNRLCFIFLLLIRVWNSYVRLKPAEWKSIMAATLTPTLKCF